MNRRGHAPVLALFLVASLAGCGMQAPQQSASSAPSPSQPPKTLTVAARYEPVSLASKALRSTGSTVAFTTRLFNAELVLQDAKTNLLPYLAEAVPQLNTASWQVFPDGKMETTYRLKPNLAWHDGEALAADDFVFAWQIYSTPDFGLANSRPQNVLEQVVAPDPRTVVVRWKAPYPEAATGMFQALPRHLLETVYQSGTADAFLNHPFWAIEYIGVGPYRLARWEPGAFVEAAAFEGHVLGRPKIDRVIVRFFTDENTALTNVLAEQVQYATDRALRYEHTPPLKQNWSPTGKGTIILTPTQWRYDWIQARPEVVQPKALLDVRVRQALAHSIDRDAINFGLYDGEGAMAETLLPRSVPYFAAIDRAITKYPYDLRRSELLMNQVGYTKGADGIFVDGAGERFAFDSRGDSGTGFEKELAVVSDGWRRGGFEPSLFVVPTAEFRNGEFRIAFRGVYSTTSGNAADTSLGTFSTSGIPVPENRFTGNNWGAWSNPDYDRFWQAFTVTLDRTERNRLVVQMLKVVSEDVFVIPLLHSFEVAAHRSNVKGPEPKPVEFNLISWNIYQWEMS